MKQVGAVYGLAAKAAVCSESGVMIDLANDTLLLADRYQGTEMARELAFAGMDLLGQLLQSQGISEEQRTAIEALIGKKPKTDLSSRLRDIETDLKAGKSSGISQLMDCFSSTTCLKEQFDLFATKGSALLDSIQDKTDPDFLVKLFKLVDQLIFQLYHLVYIPDLNGSGVPVTQVFFNSAAELLVRNEGCFYSAVKVLQLLASNGMPKPLIKVLRRLWLLYPAQRPALYEVTVSCLAALAEAEDSSETFRNSAAAFLYYLRHSPEVEIDFRSLIDAIPNVDSLTKLREYQAETLSQLPEAEASIQIDYLQVYSGYPVAAHIAPGERFSYVVDLAEPNSLLVWAFATEYCDISYSITRVDSGEELLRREERVQSDTSPISGSLLVPEPGFIRFLWDNSFSWFREKHLRYRIAVLIPIQSISESVPHIAFTSPIEIIHKDVLNEPAEDNICYDFPDPDLLELGIQVAGTEAQVKCRESVKTVTAGEAIETAKEMLAEAVKLMRRSPRYKKLGIVEKCPQSRAGLEEFGAVAVARDADALAFLSQKNLKTAHTLIAVVQEDGMRSSVMYRGKLLVSETGVPLGDLARMQIASLSEGVAQLLNVFGPAIVIVAGRDLEVKIVELAEGVRQKVPLSVWQHSVIRESILGKGVLLEAAVKLNCLHYHFKHTF